MKSKNKARRFTNPEFDGIAATPRSRLLHYSKLALPLVLTTRAFDTAGHLSSSLNFDVHLTSNFARRPNLSRITKPHDNKSNPISEPTRSKSIPTILHHVSATALLLLFRPLLLPNRAATYPCHCHCHIPKISCCLSAS